MSLEKNTTVTVFEHNGHIALTYQLLTTLQREISHFNIQHYFIFLFVKLKIKTWLIG